MFGLFCGGSCVEQWADRWRPQRNWRQGYPPGNNEKKGQMNKYLNNILKTLTKKKRQTRPEGQEWVRLSRVTLPLLGRFVSSETRREKCFQFQIESKYKSKRRPFHCLHAVCPSDYYFIGSGGSNESLRPDRALFSRAAQSTCGSSSSSNSIIIITIAAICKSVSSDTISLFSLIPGAVVRRAMCGDFVFNLIHSSFQ